ncbi:erythrocyte membrane protein 1, PfEMP1, putative [Plasmodium gaboni]|uniref:Erythrocyte membrane protein 1, PfEMP1, putative n=1 Tax=Plasmodium gaboni TaxID=647221 RepID=A0ABY0KWC7_9APIC|nr:erythrocyte membrane protein 1, PfEMP1, putative [Plasmodium gaboni]
MSGSKGGSTPTCGNTRVSQDVTDIARSFLEKAKEEATTNGKSGNDDKGELKAAFKQALFGKNLDGTKFEDDDACNLDMKKHTNDGREQSKREAGPCTGKGERFQVGVRWTKGDGEVESEHKEVLLPPRRKNMCTSNLENLNTSNMGLRLHMYASHSLLADVMLAAKEEAQKIIDQYKNPGDNESVCRALKYSFADLGDIIRGRDIWTKNGDMKNIETRLKKIFQEIKKTVTTGTDYDSDKDPYPILRREWWELNRKDVWTAMLCATKNDKLTGDCKSNNSSSRGRSGYSPTVTPPDDYIPQRLRWLTEWSEWFCKRQSQVYGELKEKCGSCKTNTGPNKPCTQADDCQKCKKACKAYQAEVEKWKADWETQKDQYTQYYEAAQKLTDGNSKSDDLNQKYLEEFLNKLQQANGVTSSGGNNVYGSAGGYIKQVLTTNGCQGQTEFCNSGSATYAFKDQPSGYQQACGCKPPVPKPTCSDNKILDAANMRHHNISHELSGRGVNLKGDASKGTYKHNNGNSTDELSDPCKLKIEHSNDSRKRGTGDGKYNGPCSGKGDQRFVIGKQWEPKTGQMRDKHSDVYLPPRRQHMCTSNLENLGKQNGTPDLLTRNNVNDSFFGDVLLAAKYEGEFISQVLGTSACNAMKYSFADIGDIIRGRDIWDKGDMARLQTHLEAIFKKIWEQNGIKDKYTDDDKATPKYKTLREHWWTANRDQIWKAMTCEAPFEATLHIPSPNGIIKWYDPQCGRNKNPPYIPVDDYIPQRLRWMTEWTENYCRKLYADYKSVKAVCIMCRSLQNSTKKKKQQENSEAEKKICKMCVDMCKVYGENVKKWKKQWDEQQSKQYSQLYDAANGSTKSGDDEITKETKEFLKIIKGSHDSLCTGNASDSNKYENAADYIDSMGGYKYCKDTSQTKFQDSDKNDEAHVFKEQPQKYKTGCDWKDPDTKKPGAGPEPNSPVVVTKSNGRDACEIVGDILKGKSGNDDVDQCRKKVKDAKDTSYPGWDCTNPNKQNLIQPSDSGACMPPRRQKLCLYYLKNMNGNEKPEELRSAFIKTAAAETFLAWNYYIHHGNGKSKAYLVDMLKNGTIPPDFKRQMVYTFGDFKDLCLNTDISNKQVGDVGRARDNIDNALKKNGGKLEEKRQEWWEANGLDIWNGMVCALSHAINDKTKQSDVQEKLTKNYKYDSEKLNTEMAKDVFYSEFVPQFLRWFTEWSDEFCIKYTEEFNTLYTKCKDCIVNSSNGKATCNKKGQECSGCQEQCAKYKTFIGKWMKDYEQQSKRYTQVKDQEPYEDFVDKDKNTHENLHQQLQLLGSHSDCMKDKSTSSGGSDDMPQSLDTYPPHGDYKSKCSCEEDTKPGVAQGPSGAADSGQTLTSGARSGRGQGARNRQTTRTRQPHGTRPQFVRKSKTRKHRKPKKDKSKDPKANTPIVQSDTKIVNGGTLTTTITTTPSPDDDIDNSSTEDEEDEDEDEEDEDDDDDDDEEDTSGSSNASEPVPAVSTTTLDPATQKVVDQGTSGTGNAATSSTPSPTHVETKNSQANGVTGGVQPDGTSANQGANADGSGPSSGNGAPDANQNSKPDTTAPPGGLTGASAPTAPSVQPPAPAPPQDPFAELDTCPFQNGSTTNPSNCKNYRNMGCTRKPFNKDLDDWTNTGVKYDDGRNTSIQNGILVPPRRRKLCLRGIRKRFDSINEKQKFKKYLIYDAYNEARLLSQYYNTDKDQALQAIKYSFADIGDIVEGKDMLNDGISDKMDQILQQLNRKNNNAQNVTRETLWNDNKTHIWHAMLCGYQKGNPSVTNMDNKWCPVPSDREPQFLRWFTEWSQLFCARKNELEGEVKSKCEKFNCDNGTTTIDQNCESACKNYKNFISGTKDAYFGQKEKYDKEFKSKNGDKDAHEYLKEKCNGKCKCLSEKFNNDDSKWQNPYETFEDNSLKSKCECQKSTTATNPAGKSSNTKDSWKDIAESLFTLANTAAKEGLDVATKLLQKLQKQHSTSGAKGSVDGSVQSQPAVLQPSVEPVQPNSLNSGSSGTGSTGNQNPSGVNHVASGSHTSLPGGAATPTQSPGQNGAGQSLGSPQTPSSSVAVGGQGTSHGSGPEPPQASPAGKASSPSGSTPSVTPSGIPTSDILTSISPVGISIALGSIALLYYLKKKTTISRPTDLFRVLEIPQNDSGIPTYRSANKYVPYTKYRGKTYIYVEDDSGDDTYVMESDTTDITTTSDSEYDELDINEIYGYGGGKHRTLIDIILRPSTSGTTHNSGDIPSGTTNSGNKHSDSSDIVDTKNSDTINSGTMDIVDTKHSDTTTYSGTTQSGNHSTSGNTYSDTIPGNTTTYSDNHSTSGNHSYGDTHSYSDTTIPGNTTTHSDNHFIIQIQDRQLGGGKNTYIYDVGGDTNSGTPGTSGTNIYTTTHNMDIPKYMSPHTHNMDNTTYTTTYVSPSGTYSGINLINDSLYRDRHIDIYKELLQRKEKELNSGRHTT